LQLTLSDDFSKTVQRAPLKKLTQINSIEKKLLLLLLQPTPCTSCNNQPLQTTLKAEKQLNPTTTTSTREKRHATGPKPRKNPTQKSLHPRLNTHILLFLITKR